MSLSDAFTDTLIIILIILAQFTLSVLLQKLSKELSQNIFTCDFNIDLLEFNSCNSTFKFSD